MKTATYLSMALMCLWFARPAWAQDCATDADCPDGLVCVMLPCACPDDAECPDCGGGMCMDDWGGGSEGECLTDADCPEGSVCIALPCACRDGEECPECAGGGFCATDGGGFAGDCASDADCPDGMICELYDAPCAVPACECACPDCPEGAECPDCECACPEPEDCISESFGFCAEAPIVCTSDADCPDGFTCLLPGCACPEGAECDCAALSGTCEAVYTDPTGDCTSDADCPAGLTCEIVELPCMAPMPCACACPDCREGEECPPCDCSECPEADPLPCEPVSYGFCTYVAPDCTSDADCQEGFECVAQQECWSEGCACGGCACPECPDGEECPPCDCPEEPECDCPAEPEEHCQVTGSFCQPRQVACTADADCADGWECIEDFGDCAVSTCACAPCPEGEECPPCDCPEEEYTCESESFCLPAGWAAAQDYGDWRPGTEEGGETSNPESPSDTDDGSTPEPEPAPGDGTPNGDPAGDGSGAAAGDGNAETTLGCAAAPAGSADLLFLLVLGGLAALTAYGRRSARATSR